MKPTLDSLMKRWRRKTGEPIPESILRMEFDLIEKAVKRVESGDVVFVPRETDERTGDGFGFGDSMREWDHDWFY